jgi:1-acyl-sn-glycerol-3-phosphate acyltransferase
MTEAAAPPKASRRPGLWALVMSAVVYPLLFLQTLIFILLAPVVLPLASVLTGRPLGRIVRYFIWIYGKVWMILIAPFTRFEKIGLTLDRFPQPCIIVLNHLSFFDVFCMGALPHSNVGFTVRSWPFRMIWYAPFMRMAEYVDMETLGHDEALHRCGELLDNETTLVFFPEGHRGRDGKLGRFYSGAFKLAVETNVPIVPLCISGTDRLLPPGALLMAPATIRLQALPAVDPSDFTGESGHVALRKAVKVAMAEALEKQR